MVFNLSFYFCLSVGKHKPEFIYGIFYPNHQKQVEAGQEREQVAGED